MGSPQPVCHATHAEEENDKGELSPLHLDSPGQALPLNITVTVDDHSTAMEVDSGAALLLVSETTFKKLWPGRLLLTSTVRLCSYSGELNSVVGCQEYRSQLAN